MSNADFSSVAPVKMPLSPIIATINVKSRYMPDNQSELVGISRLSREAYDLGTMSPLVTRGHANLEDWHQGDSGGFRSTRISSGL